ncbi:MAG: hypothetical protein WA045_10940, partial [Nitrospira sp.]
MNRKPTIQLIHIAAACTFWLTTVAYAAEQAVDGTIQSSTPSANEPSPGNGLILPTYSHSNGQPTAPLIEPFDPNAPPRATIPIGPNLFIGGYVSLEGETNRNYRLSSTLGKAD